MRTKVVGTLIFLGLLAAALLAATGTAGQGPQRPAEETAAKAPEPAEASKTESVEVLVKVEKNENGPLPQGSGGMTVYKDPETGRLLPVPADQLQRLLSPDLRKTISTSPEGLVESAAPGGGVMINLQGRFKSLAWATANSKGSVMVHCDQKVSSQAPAALPQSPRN